MSIQIAVRLPDDIVASIDEAVREGRAASRADLVARALRRELRRQRAVADLPRLPGADDPDHLGDLADHAAGVALPLD